MRDLLELMTAAAAAGRACTLCTLVETRGSTPQKAGAAMLVFPDGSQAGTLGGGCVEAEVKRKVLAAGAEAVPELHQFQLDRDYGWDDGLICGGRMTILADPLTPEDREGTEYFNRFSALVAAGAGGYEVLTLAREPDRPLGSRYLLSGERRELARRRAAVSAEVALPELAGRPKPQVTAGWAILPVWPRIRLVIVGGGHVGQAVADLAAQADFDVWVLDDRQAYANAERFPRAQRLVVGAIPESLRQLRDQATFNASTYAIIVTRGHQHDEEALFELAQATCGYVGLIGSRRKIRMIFEDLEGKGIPPAALKCVHAPLGVNIGSQTVPEIAISIVAELIAHRNLGRVPEALRDRRLGTE